MKTMVATTWQAMWCFVFASVFGAFGQFLYKAGVDKAAGGGLWALGNAWILGGIVCYIAVMALFVAGFKFGGNLAVLYPLYASTFIWAALISFFAYGTPIRPINLAGMALLILGMYCMGKSS